MLSSSCLFVISFFVGVSMNKDIVIPPLEEEKPVIEKDETVDIKDHDLPGFHFGSSRTANP